MYIKVRIIDTEFIHDLFDIYFIGKDFDFVSYLALIIINHITNLSDGENLSDIRKNIVDECQKNLQVFKIYVKDVKTLDRLCLDSTGYYVSEILYYGLYQEEINLEYPLKKFEINMSNEDYYLNFYSNAHLFHSQLYSFLIKC